MALRINSDHVIYMIPAYKSNNERDNNLYSVSININGNIIDTKLTTIEINNDGTQTKNTRNFNFSNLTSKNQTYATYVDMEIKCDCVAIISDCTCHTSHASGGCDHPDVSINCSNCSGGSGISITNPSTSTNNNTSTSNNQIVAISNSSSGSNYSYTYNLSGNGVYFGLMKKYQPDYVFSALQKYNIINTPEIINPLLQFLDIDGSSQMNKDFALSIIDAIEEGTVTTYQEFNVLLNAYKKAKVALLIEEQIDDTLLDSCTKAVFDKLKNLKQSDIANMLIRFAPTGSIFNINMSTGIVQNNDPNTWAQTTPVSGSNNNINMIFNQDYVNGKDNPNRPTDLSVATTMTHEIIHAYLISLLEDNKICGTSGICDFPTIYGAYVQQQITKNPNLLPSAHHDLIAEKYVDAIAATIQEYHTGQPVASGFPNQVYLDMAWGGLQGTDFFNKNYPNDPTHKNYKDRERILGRITAERIGSQYGVNSPLGTPCKK